MILDLTGHEVRIYGRKADGKEFYNEGVITDHKKGRCQFELTTQALAVAQDLSVEIVIYKDNTEILSTLPFTIHVVKSLMSDSSVESSNEYGALVVLYQDYYEAKTAFEETKETLKNVMLKLGEPDETFTQLEISTMYEALSYMINFQKENSTEGIVDKVNTIDSKIGTSRSNKIDTVFGKLNNLGIKSIQYGTIQGKVTNSRDEVFTNNNYLDVTISEINTKKSIVVLNQSLSNNTGFSWRFINSTTLRIIVTYSAINGLVWQVIEFY